MPRNLYCGNTLNSVMFDEVDLQEFFYFNTFLPRLNDGMGILLSRTPLICRCRCTNFQYFKRQNAEIMLDYTLAEVFRQT